MAGGTEQLYQTPYPKGGDGLVCITFGPFDVPDSAQTDEIVDRFTTQFAFKAVKCEVTALKVTDVNSSFSVNIEDDSGTPKVLVADAVVAAVALGTGSSESLTVDRDKIIFAGALLRLTYTSTGSDVCLSVKVRLWVKPVY
jgi:hypothetical protein